ncbi:MAG: L,D-transpeptidase [Acidobacteria bacterium]|nr:L,D-transpeptidase [Acidobacteriota bacterium]
MIRIGKRLIVVSCLIALGLLFALGGYKAWSMGSVRDRPWILEGGLRYRLAECRTGPGLISFQHELDDLEAGAKEAEACMASTDQKVWFLRSYSECISKAIAVERKARLLRMKMDQREQDQRDILDALLPSLNLAFSGGNANKKSWSRFNLTGMEIARAKSFLQQAEIFYGQDEIELSFNTAHRALIFWGRFSRGNDGRFARFSDAALRKTWNQQVNRLLQWSKSKGRRAIIVDKFNHLCLLIQRGRVQKRYSADLGRKWYQRKSQARDASVPEGEYAVSRMIPRGKYGQALMIDYPSAEDTARFQSLRRKGILPAGARIGGYIEIHGGGGKDSDWTDGCVALNDDDMRELYGFAYAGMPVTIVGISSLASGAED